MAQHLVSVCTFIIIIVLPIINFCLLTKVIKILNEMRKL